MLIDFKRLLLPWFAAALILTGCQQDLNGQLLETNTPASPTITVTLSEPTEIPTPESADEELGEDVVLTLWHPFSGRLGGVFENLVDEFNRDNDPKITIKIESHADVDVLSEDIEEAHGSGGQLPHMVIAPSHMLKTWHQSGLPLLSEKDYPLDPALENDAFPGVFPAFWSRDVIEGERIGFPVYQSGNFLFYNRSFAKALGFDDIPKSRAEFREQACRAAQTNLFDDAADNNGTGGWIYTNEAESIAAWMLGAQLSAGENDGNLLPFSKAENLDALQFILDLYRDDCAWTGKESIPFGYFSRRYALFYSGTSEDIFTQNNFQINEESSDDWVLISYPGQEGGSVFLINGYSAALFTSEVNEIRAALEFIRWIFQEDVQASIVENSGAFPISNAVYQTVDADWELFPIWEPMIGYLPFGKNINRIENWMLVEKILEDLGWQLVQYNIQPAMVESLLERADELITEYE